MKSKCDRRNFIKGAAASAATFSLSPDYALGQTGKTMSYPRLKDGETLNLRVFIDKSVVEVYANGKQYAAVRVYPGLEESTGVFMRSQGQDSELISLDAWQMKNMSGDKLFYSIIKLI